MGYHTHFHLTTSAPEHDANHQRAVAKLVGYRETVMIGNEEAKWLNHEADMLEYSRKWPDVVFRLAGVGDGDLDRWVKWFKNGKMQRWELVVEEPNDPPEEW